MIKASDLRIGNLVTINNPKSWPLMMGVPVKVIAVELVTDYPGYTGSASLEGQNRQRYGQFDEFIAGIPLSEDWLIRMGFTRVPHFTVTNSFILDIGRNRIISIQNVGTGNEMIWLCEVDSFDKKFIQDLVCLRNYDYDGSSYVHTIQNIGHAFTGSELTIKE